jgi:hypothetical protein
MMAIWQKLNVTAFLTSGIVRANEGLLGEPLDQDLPPDVVDRSGPEVAAGSPGDVGEKARIHREIYLGDSGDRSSSRLTPSSAIARSDR